ncbi:TIGR03915 family putative DNA repair protein [Halioxenophilus aromaticivorans]|uniref:DUF4130 domain-containing protein n=1 Tax=Halioxenophilus aromaticivorans TaxID=1306992 RepID=A0AAV3U379_9ALTE
MFEVDVDDLKAWRKLTRKLLKRKIDPTQLTWNSTGQQAQQGLVFGGDDFEQVDVVNPTPTITAEFLQLLARASCYRDEQKWAVFYSLAYRLVYENKNLLQDAIDPQVKLLRHWHQTICRDIHKMEAFVRFQKLDHDLLGEVYFAWFEPEHDIFATAAPFFVKRFKNMTWSLLSPSGCMHWDQTILTFSEGIARPQGMQDDCESLWQQYYRSIFNPARLKVQAMQSEMPKKYWKNLPEAALIKDLIRNAQSTSEGYVAADAAQPWQKTAKSKRVQQQQAELRQKRND